MGICAKKTEASKQQIKTDVIETAKQKVEKEDKNLQSNSTIKIIVNSQQEKPPHSFEKSLHEGGQKVIDQQNNKNEYDEIFDKFQINHDTQFRQNKQIIGHKNQEVKDENISNDPPKLLSLTFVKSQLLTSKQIKQRAKQKIEQDLQALLENHAQQQTKQQQQKEAQQKYVKRQSKNEQQSPQQEVKNLIQLQRQIEDYMVKQKEKEKEKYKEKEKEKQTIKNHITYRPNMKKTSINRKQYQEWKPPI